jgi:hypothetical protein
MLEVRGHAEEHVNQALVVVIELVKPIDGEAKLRLEFGLCQQFKGTREL